MSLSWWRLLPLVLFIQSLFVESEVARRHSGYSGESLSVPNTDYEKQVRSKSNWEHLLKLCVNAVRKKLDKLV